MESLARRRRRCNAEGARVVLAVNEVALGGWLEGQEWVWEDAASGSAVEVA